VESWAERKSGLVVPEEYADPDLPTCVDLFAGCGGFSCGFHVAGWHVVGAVEMDFAAAVTYMVNLANPGVEIHFDTDERREGFEAFLRRSMQLEGRKKNAPGITPVLVAGSGWIRHFWEDCGCYPGHHEGIGYDGKLNEYLQEINARPPHPFGCEHFWIHDARTLHGRDILDALSMEVGEIDCVIGGPPCQGFSTAGKRDVMDPRNSLVFEFARLVVEMHPKTMIMENVPNIVNMVTPEGMSVVDAICHILERGEFGEFRALRQALTGRRDARAVFRRDSTKPQSAKEARVLTETAQMMMDISCD